MHDGEHERKRMDIPERQKEEGEVTKETRHVEKTFDVKMPEKII